MKAMKKLLVLFLALATVFGLAAIPAFAADNGYTDVKEDAWFYEAVVYATENGLMNGMGNEKFEPSTISTRGMVVTILHRMEGEPKSEKKVTFKDLKQDWYKGAVAWANENGIVEGYSEIAFGPEDMITREQLATMAYRYAVKYLGRDGSAAGDLKAFPDADKVSDWAKDAMVWAVGEGLINGNEIDGVAYLDPQGKATRAQLATVLMRLNEKVSTHTHNLEYTAAVEATCHQNGMNEYWYCADCDCYFSDAEGKYNVAYLRLTIPATVGLTYVPAAEACHVPGISEYWYCTECEAVYADAEGKILTNRKNLEIEPDAELVYVPAAEACHVPGTAEYWYCPDCEAVYADAEGKVLTNRKNLEIAPDAELIHMDAVEACHANGSYEYWYCPDCEAVYADAEGKMLTNRKNLTIEADTELEHVEAVEVGCHTNGMQEYWYCEKCDCFFTDAEGKYNIAYLSLTIPSENTIVHIEAVEPGCHYEGNIEYWYCPGCEIFWQDEALTQITNSKNVIRPELNNYEVEHVAESCYNTEYWFCAECEQYWADEAMTQLTNSKNVIKAVADHNIVAMEAVEPGCHYEGNIAHWYCTECDNVWADEALTEQTNHKNVIVPALGGEIEHVAESCYNTEYWFCENCEQYWVDEALTQITNSKNVNKAVPSHELEHVAESCYNTEYWFCSVCETYWADEALTQLTNSKNVIKAETTHNLEHVAESCYNTEYWFCSACESYWADEALTQTTNVKNVNKAEPTHELKHTDAVEVTCLENGMQEYWYCEKCDTHFSDAEAKYNISYLSLTIPATGHSFSFGTCQGCELVATDFGYEMEAEVNVGEYYGFGFPGTTMTVEADAVILDGTKYEAVEGVVTVEVPAAMGRYIGVFVVEDADAETVVVSFNYPAGTMDNPAELEPNGENIAKCAGDWNGYWFTWTATANGVLTVDVSGETGWTFAINNMTAGKYGDTQWSDSDEVVNTVEVIAGDVIEIMVNTYDAEDMMNIPVGTIYVNTVFTAAE